MECMDCPGGTFTNAEGLTACTDCAPGSHRLHCCKRGLQRSPPPLSSPLKFAASLAQSASESRCVVQVATSQAQLATRPSVWLHPSEPLWQKLGRTPPTELEVGK
eukprot:3035720-Amphidinium_carterae.1